MPKKPSITKDPAELRRRAEERLRGESSEVRGQRSETDTAALLHELEVHQIELEMQNAELQAARDELEAALEKYTDLYDFAPVGYLTLDQDGVIREANLAGASLLRIERSAFVNRRFGLFVSAADRPVFEAFLQQVFQGKGREECDVRLLAEGKHPLDVRLRANIPESGQACRVAVTDITEHKRAEADRLILNKLASTGILAGGIAHDFNNLLTVILLNVELAHMLNPLGGEAATHLEEAKQTALFARGLTAQLVTFAEGGAPIRKPMFLSGLIQESVRPALSGSNVRCEFSLAEDLWAAEVDAGQIAQVIRNLVLNAREAMPEGGVVTVQAANVVLGPRDRPSLPAGQYVRLSIADQGAGIAQEVLPKIFDPYFSTKHRGPQKGMGLGLTICHAVVQKHGGAIDVESLAGAGTTFQVYLPATQKLSGADIAPAPAGMAMAGQVLVMDDDAVVRKVVGLALQRMGHEVELTADGESAVESYLKAKNLGRPFDVVILDLMVPAGMGGKETIQALLLIDPSVKAVLMSGYGEDPVVLEHERYGFKGALPKPFDHEKLQEILCRVMGAGAVKAK